MHVLVGWLAFVIVVVAPVKTGAQAPAPANTPIPDAQFSAQQNGVSPVAVEMRGVPPPGTRPPAVLIFKTEDYAKLQRYLELFTFPPVASDFVEVK